MRLCHPRGNWVADHLGQGEVFVSALFGLQDVGVCCWTDSGLLAGVGKRSLLHPAWQEIDVLVDGH